MIQEINIGKKGVLAYTLHAFTTDRGIFTLVGTDCTTQKIIDTFKNLTTVEYHDWERSKVMEWVAGGKVQPVSESNRLDWYKLPRSKSEGLQGLKTRRK